MIFIVLYTVLSTRYSYNINEIENIITFIYLYGFNLINILIEILKHADKRGVQIYEEDECMSYEGEYRQSRNIKSRTSNK